MTTTPRDEPGRAPAHDRRRLRTAPRRVSRHLDLQDPLPRRSGPPATESHARWLPAVRRGRRRAADHDPAASARRVSATACDQGGAARPDRRPCEAPCRRSSWSRGGDRHGGALRAGRHLGGVRAATRGLQPARTTHRRPATGSTARARPTSRSRARGSPGTASTHDISARSEPRQGVSRRCSSRSSPRRFAHGTPSVGRQPSRTSRALPGVAQELAQLLLTRDLKEVAER